MLVYVNVKAADAVKAGKTRSGKLPVTITEDWLAGLTEEERAVVAPFAGEENAGTINVDVYGERLPGVSEATLDTLLVIVRAKLQIESAKQIERAKEEADRRELIEKTSQAVLRDPSIAVWGPDRHNAGSLCDYVRSEDRSVEFSCLSDEAKNAAKAHQAVVLEEIQRRNELRKVAEAAAEAKRSEAAKVVAENAKRFREACDALIREVGTEDQKGRLEDDLLPQDEVDQIVRDYVYRPLELYSRYDKLTKADVEHEEDENGYGCEGTVEFEAEGATEMPGGPWRTLVAIRKAAPDGAVVTPRYHKAECDSCSGKTDRYSAKVEVTWHGRTFCREYAL